MDKCTETLQITGNGNTLSGDPGYGTISESLIMHTPMRRDIYANLQWMISEQAT
jgi:hypothetical protein